TGAACYVAKFRHRATLRPRFSEVPPSFLDFMSKDNGWRGQTLAQNTATYKMFIACCDDRPVTKYELKDLAAFMTYYAGFRSFTPRALSGRGSLSSKL
ncbi:MAG: hypothetical protein ACRD9W_00120, partial [Terriglobia bacterium]